MFIHRDDYLDHISGRVSRAIEVCCLFDHFGGRASYVAADRVPIDHFGGRAPV